MALANIAAQMKKYALDHPRLGSDIKPYQYRLERGLTLTCQYIHRKGEWQVSLSRATVWPSYKEVGIVATAFGAPVEVKTERVTVHPFNIVRLIWAEPIAQQLPLMKKEAA